MNDAVVIGNATLYNCDCMEYMRGLPDKAFDLAIVDPPYGIDRAKPYTPVNPNKPSGFYPRWETSNIYEKKDWDKKIPNEDYFNELLRISKNVIVCGGNYFSSFLPIGNHWIVWDKQNTMPTFSDCELLYTNIERNSVKKFVYSNNGLMAKETNRIHPTQKPVKLYEWLLTNYAKPGQRILDTHLGSMSSVIACLNMDFEIVGCELDTDYFKAGIERVHQSQQQLRMFA